MWIDILVILYVALVTYLGYRQGLLKQVLSIAAAVIALLFAGPLANFSRRIIPITYILNLILCAFVIYTVCRILFWLLNSQLGKGEGGQVRPWNRNAGIAVAVVKGEVFAWAIVCLLLTLVTAVSPKFMPGLRKSLEGSVSGRIAAATNPFQSMGDFIADLRVVAGDSRKRDAFLADPRVKAFMKDAQVETLLGDTSLVDKLDSFDAKLYRKAKEKGVLDALHTHARRQP